MTKFAKFTNDADQFKGDTFYVNKDIIITVHKQKVFGGSSKTILFANPSMSWEVQESVEEAVKRLSVED